MKKDLAEDCLKNLKTKKISINLDEDTLDFIDELSNITNTTRTTTIMSIIGHGMKEVVNSLEKALEKAKKESSKPEKAEASLKNLEKFRKKWNIDKWPV